MKENGEYPVGNILYTAAVDTKKKVSLLLAVLMNTIKFCDLLIKSNNNRHCPGQIPFICSAARSFL